MKIRGKAPFVYGSKNPMMQEALLYPEVLLVVYFKYGRIWK